LENDARRGFPSRGAVFSVLEGTESEDEAVEGESAPCRYAECVRGNYNYRHHYPEQREAPVCKLPSLLATLHVR